MVGGSVRVLIVLSTNNRGTVNSVAGGVRGVGVLYHGHDVVVIIQMILFCTTIIEGCIHYSCPSC